MSISFAARRIITLFLVATLLPVQGMAWPGWSGKRAGSKPVDALAWRAFLTAMNSTDQLVVMTGPGRPQIYFMFKVDMVVEPTNTSLITAEGRAWLDQILGELAKQTPATNIAANAEPKESILDEIAASDAQVRSMQSATRLSGMPDRLDFEANPNASVPVERSMSVAIQDALQQAGFDNPGNNGGTTFTRGTGTVRYEGQFADGDVVVTGTLVNGQIVLTKEFKPLTVGGDVGDPVTIRGTNSSTPSNTSTQVRSAGNTTSTNSTPAGATTITPSVASVTPPAPATTVRIVPGDGSPGDSVYASQVFRVEATAPANGAPPVLTAALTTHDGQSQTVVLVPQGTRDGVTTYTSPQISFHGGRLAQGTLQGLELTNGQIVSVAVPGGRPATVAVYTDDVQLGISRINEALNATSEELIRQRTFVDSQMKIPTVASDSAQMETLRQWRADIDNKITWIRQTRELMAGTDQPGLQLMYGQRRFDWLTQNWDEFDRRAWYGDQVIVDQFKERKSDLFTDVMRGFTMGTYQQVARMSMIAQLRAVTTGYNEFGKKLTYEELLAENKGLAFDLAMFWVPGKFTDSLVNGGFSGELVISAGTPGGRILVPTRTMAGGGGAIPSGGRTPEIAGAKPPVVALTGGVKPTVAVNTPDAPPAGAKPTRTPTAFNEDPAIPQVDRGLDGKPGAPVTRVSDADVGPTDAFDAEMVQVYNTNLTRARAAGVSEERIKQIIGDGEMTKDKAELFYRDAIVAEKNINIPRSEYATLAGIDVRNLRGGLTEADYQFLKNKLAQDPTYIDNLPNRGRMPQELGAGDGFSPAITAEQRDLLLQNPRVAQMVDDAKSAAAANVTPLDPNKTTINPNQTIIVDPNKTALIPSGAQPGVAGVADNTGTVIVPRRTPSPATPTVRDPNVTTVDPNQTTITPNQTVIIDPNKTAIIPPGAQPGVAGIAENAPTVIVPRGAKPSPATPTVRDPNVTTLDPSQTTITPQQTVIIDPNKTSLMPAPDPNTTARMADELMQSLPKAQQSGMTPQQAVNSIRGTMSKLGVSPQQLVSALRQRFFAPRPVSISDLSNPTTAAAQGGAQISLDAIGVSSGVAFNLNAVNNGTMPVRLQGEGIVVEPVRGGPVLTRDGGPGAAIRAQVVTDQVEAFCLERTRPVAPPGTQYRVAPPEVQMQHRRLIDVLHAAQRVMDIGGLKPDSDPKSYFNFIRQWSIWSRQENFDEKRFSEEFMNQTKKNVEGQGVKWTNAMQETVRKATPGRWLAIKRVLDEAVRLAPRG